MDFPNPLVRTDLPVKRRRWPRILLAGALLLILGVVFLPQILSSKAGRKFVVNAITSRTRSEVTLSTFKTSWFGGTQVTFLNIKDSMGRRIGCKSLTCQAGLWKLLRNNFQLGDTTVEGLHLDWVVDDGRETARVPRSSLGLIPRPASSPASPERSRSTAARSCFIAGRCSPSCTT